MTSSSSRNLPGHGLRYILLRHSSRSTKVQHYELYACKGPGGAAGCTQAVFDESSLPAGVKRAFARVCPDTTTKWAEA